MSKQNKEMNFISSYIYDGLVMIEYIGHPLLDSNTIDVHESSVEEFKIWLRKNMPTYYHKCMVTNRGTSTRHFDVDRLDSRSEAFQYYLMDNVK